MKNTRKSASAVPRKSADCKFVDSLSDERIDWLVMHPPLGKEILQHALTCDSCALRISRIVHAATSAEAAKQKDTAATAPTTRRSG